MVHYADTSALVKLVVAEPETEALRSWLSMLEPRLVACDLVRTELVRSVRRAAPSLAVRATMVLEMITIIELTPRIFEAAGRIGPVALRSLDSLHLAAALDLGDDLEGFVCYDERLSAAAGSNGIMVLAPS